MTATTIIRIVLLGIVIMGGVCVISAVLLQMTGLVDEANETETDNERSEEE